MMTISPKTSNLNNSESIKLLLYYTIIKILTQFQSLGIILVTLISLYPETSEMHTSVRGFDACTIFPFPMYIP